MINFIHQISTISARKPSCRQEKRATAYTVLLVAALTFTVI